MPPAYVDLTQDKEPDNGIKSPFRDMKKTAQSPLNPTTKDLPFESASAPPYAESHMDKMIPESLDSQIHSSVKSAMQLAAENYFQSGAFAKAMSDSVHRVATIQTTFRHDGVGAFASSGEYQPPPGSTGSSAELIQSMRRGNQSRICYRTSATGFLFGTVWLRTTSVQLDSHRSKNGRKIDVVSSFTFFPSYWLTAAGINYGLEANMFTTSTGWQFNFNPIRAVPDDAPIFSAARSGNISAVRFLLAEGKASVRDTNSKGWNPLHVSITLKISAISR